jgi:glycosyltransferase involved in cell wall biosynthesis
VKVCIVAEFYPRAADPVLGVWAHRQALAAREAGADVRVVVLHRPIPPRAQAGLESLRTAAAQPRRATLDGIEIDYLRYVSPPRPRGYGSWGAWAAPALAMHLRRLRSRFAFELIHAHNAVPSGEAIRRTRLDVPLAVSVHGGDVFFTAPRYRSGAAAVRATFAAARLVLANSAGIAEAARALGASDIRVVHLGTDLPPLPEWRRPGPTLVTLGHLVARKRHADVLRALALLEGRHPGLRYLVIGDGPERAGLEGLAGELGLAERVEFAGQLDPDVALQQARECSLLVMPSVDEAFGVAYVEAMAGGLPAIGCQREPGPEEIAAAGEGMRLVPARAPEALATEIDRLVSEPGGLRVLGEQARATVAERFSWARCGAATVQAYADALR